MLELNKINYKDNIVNKELTYNENTFNVRSHLFMEEKLALIGNIINSSVDENTYYNPARLHIYYVVGIVKAYTDITFVDDNVLEAYDALVISGLWEQIEQWIDEAELKFIKENVLQTIENIYDYRNSVMGVIESFNASADNLKLDSEEIQKNLSDPNNLKLVKDILEKMG